MSDETNTLPEKRPFQINKPGFINIDNGRSVASGCKLAVFHHADLVNEFFRTNANLLTINIWSDAGNIYVLYTNQLTGEELEEFHEFSRTVSIMMSESRQKREAAAQAEARRMTEAETEVKRKLELAERCEKNHGGLVEENRKLKAKAKGK